MALLINGQAISDAVALDGLPRVATDTDDVQHVLYLDGATVRSMLSADWPPPLPTTPTAQQIADAITARQAAAAAELAAIAALRVQIVNLAQSAVGVRIDLLTAGQRNAIIACLAWKSGAIANDMTVRPLGEWLNL